MYTLLESRGYNGEEPPEEVLYNYVRKGDYNNRESHDTTQRSHDITNGSCDNTKNNTQGSHDTAKDNSKGSHDDTGKENYSMVMVVH